MSQKLKYTGTIPLKVVVDGKPVRIKPDDEIKVPEREANARIAEGFWEQIKPEKTKKTGGK